MLNVRGTVDGETDEQEVTLIHEEGSRKLDLTRIWREDARGIPGLVQRHGLNLPGDRRPVAGLRDVELDD